MVEMKGTKELEDGTVFEVHFEADYEQQQKKFDVFVNGEQIDRFHETKKFFWYKAEVHFEADYEQQQKKFDVFVNGEQIDRFHETKKFFWYKALAKAPAATVVRNFENEQEFQDYVGKVRKWFEDSGYTIEE